MYSGKYYSRRSFFSSLIFFVCTFFLFILNSLILFHISDPLSVYGLIESNLSEISQKDAQLIFLNLERINLQIDLTSQNLKDNNTEGAFYHSYIPHSITYPTIKQYLEKVDPSASIKLEGLLTDLPIFINSKSNKESQSSDVFSSVNLESNLNQIQDVTENLTRTLLINRVDGTIPSDMLPILSNNDLLTLQTSLLLLDDSLQSYINSNLSNVKSAERSTNPLNLVDYENSMGLVKISERLISSIRGLDSNTIAESQLYYDKLNDAIRNKQGSQTISKLINYVKSNYDATLAAETAALSDSENEKYFKNIYELLSKVIESVSIGKYPQAYNYAVEAYLDNYEYLEAPIEKVDATLKNTLEIELRENLISKIDSRQPPSEISLFVNKTILPNLLKAESLLQSLSSTINTQPNIQSANQLDNKTSFTSTFANIDSLREGFGVYTGERKIMGGVADSQKQLVRNNVDEIRLGLNKILTLYQEQKYDESKSEARAVYLNSYENIEIPLRPINPDFTLDMEIKFAELRNLLEKKVPYETIEKKIIEIRNGLDESERLVSGTGIIAPTIAFSSSLSIIFREGLESALIIGAMLTYLEASRNEKFKKHIYFGILLAIVATTIMWMVADNLIKITGANRELIEGAAGISAVAVLFWVSFWVLNKIETKKWIEFVKAKVWQATATGSVMVFVMLSFFTIFREGFETVLFYQSMFSYAK
ncbi:MAG: FTR1 family protein, partial [Candidatus Nitrosocosmicus sp.]